MAVSKGDGKLHPAFPNPSPATLFYLLCLFLPLVFFIFPLLFSQDLAQMGCVLMRAAAPDWALLSMQLHEPS